MSASKQTAPWIGKTNGIFASPSPLPACAGSRSPRAAPAAPPAHGGRLPQQRAVWPGGVGWVTVARQGVTGGEGLGTSGLQTLRGDDCKREFTAQRGAIHRCGVHLAYGPTLA
jgi:hypothetical protein